MLGALRGERAVSTTLGLIVLAVLTAAACVGVLSLTSFPLPVARTLIVLAGASVFLSFLLGPVLAGSVDQLDPRRFATFGVAEQRMPWLLALMALISVPSFALLAIGICVGYVAVQLGTPWPLTVVAALIGLLSIVLAARIAMAVSALVLPERRSRELTAIFVLVVVVVAFPIAVFLASLGWNGAVPPLLEQIITVVGMTPIAATFGFSFAIAAGDVPGTIISGSVAVLTLVGLWLLWHWLVIRLLTTTEKPSASRERSGLGWFAILPANATGAIAARSLVYWLRDRRYIVNLLVVPIAGVLAAFPLLIAGVPLTVAGLIPVLLIALFFGWLPHNDIAYDSTAFWTHVASGARGIADRVGRLAPIALIAVPILAVAVPLTLAIVGSWHMLPALSGLTVCLFLTSIGFSSVASVTAPYAVSRPGDSPFQQPQRSLSHGAFGPAGVFLASLVLSAPTIWLFSMCLMGHTAVAWITLAVGAGTGILMLALCLFVGGRIYDRSGERLMEFVETA